MPSVELHAFESIHRFKPFTGTQRQSELNVVRIWKDLKMPRMVFMRLGFTSVPSSMISAAMVALQSEHIELIRDCDLEVGISLARPIKCFRSWSKHISGLYIFSGSVAEVQLIHGGLINVRHKGPPGSCRMETTK